MRVIFQDRTGTGVFAKHVKNATWPESAATKTRKQENHRKPGNEKTKTPLAFSRFRVFLFSCFCISVLV